MPIAIVTTYIHHGLALNASKFDLHNERPPTPVSSIMASKHDKTLQNSQLRFMFTS